MRGKIMSGRLSVLQLRTSPLKKGPHSPGTEKGSLGCWLFPTPRPPRPGREYPGAGRKGGGTGHACVSTGARGARTAGSGCRGLLTLVLVQLTQGQAPLRPGSPAQKHFRSSRSTHTAGFCWVFLVFWLVWGFFFIFHYERLDGVYSKLLIQRENRSR